MKGANPIASQAWNLKPVVSLTLISSLYKNSAFMLPG